MILYGIPTCDTCKKAIKALEAAGNKVEFRDIRADPLSPDELAEFYTEFGDRLVNLQSSTYRGLSDWLRASEPEVQIAAHPTLMKRPIIRHENNLFLGWDDEIQAEFL